MGTLLKKFKHIAQYQLSLASDSRDEISIAEYKRMENLLVILDEGVRCVVRDVWGSRQSK